MTAKKSVFCYIDHKTGDHDHMNAHIRIASCDETAMTAPVRYSAEEIAHHIERCERCVRKCDCDSSDLCIACDELKTAAAMLRQAAADGQKKCAMGVYCREHNFIHGAEAEELRERFEKLADAWGNEAGRKRIMHVLDDVDARDAVTVPATPTEPTTPPAHIPKCQCPKCQPLKYRPAVASVPRCGTCVSWNTGDKNTMTAPHCTHFRGPEAPADSSGFCHLHEITK